MAERVRVDRRGFLKTTAAGFVVLFTGGEFSGTLILAHGYNGTPGMGIYSALGSRVPSELNLLTVIPDLPLSNHNNTADPQKLMNPEAASDRLAELIESAQKPVILAGHSLGVNIALYTLSRYAVTVDAALLIAGRYKTPSGDPLLDQRCYGRQLYPSIIRDHIRGPFVAVNSLDDTVVQPPETNLGNIASTFGAKPVLAHNQGHFDQPASAPYLVGLLKSEILPLTPHNL